MGGSSTLPLVREERGAYFDLTTWDLVQEVKRLAGPVYVNPMDGCGSFQGRRVLLEDGRVVDLGATEASAETHEGEGAGDVAVSSDEEGRLLETLFRRVGCAAWYRPLVSPYTGRKYGWGRHVHFLRIGARLSPSAQAQVEAYLAGLDGLATPHKDTGTRAYVDVTWERYLEQKEDTMTPEQEKRILDAIRAVPGLTWSQVLTGHDEDGAGPLKAPKAPALSWLVMARRDAGRTYWATDSLEPSLVKVQAAVEDLPHRLDALEDVVEGLGAGNVDEAAVQAIRDAVAGLRFTLEQVPVPALTTSS
jgi:hypothetical protein